MKTTVHVPYDPYKSYAIASAILASCVLALYILQQMGVVPLSLF